MSNMDFDKDLFLKLFRARSRGRGVAPEDDWYFLVELFAENNNFSIEEALLEYFWMGVEYKTKQYQDEIDRELL